MKILVESQRSDLVVLDIEMLNKSFIFDVFNDVIGNGVGVTHGDWYLADFQNGVIEVIPPDRYEVISIADQEWDDFIEENSIEEIDLVENPFGSWIAGKAKGVMKRRTAKKALGRRLKAESTLSKARKAEADAIKAATKNPFNFFARKKKFYVDFWGDGELHQTTITARSKADAIKIAGKGYSNFTVNEAEEAE
jgi:hypothetical protein